MADWTYAECTSNRCQAPIIWTVTERKQERMPVDAEPVKHGEILLLPNPLDPATPISRVERNAGKRFAKHCYVSHFATCPDAASFRLSRAR